MQNITNGYDVFLNVVFSLNDKYILPLLEQLGGNEREEASFNLIFESKPQPEIKLSCFMDKDRLHDIIFYGFCEISNSWYILNDCEIYIGRFPFPKTKITKEGYLLFIIGAYYSELYILRERLNSYTIKISRAFKKRGFPFNDEILKDMVTEPLKDVLGVRAHHIHKGRIEVNELGRLSMLASIIKQSSDKKFKGIANLYYKLDYRKTRKEWKKLIIKNNIEVKKLLDAYFNELYPMVFNSDIELLD